jgi:hypothetical protein
VWAEFITSTAAGAATNADSLPTGTVNKNGTDDGAVSVTVTNIDAGRYKATFTVPATYLPGDTVTLTIAATVSSVAAKAVVGSWRLGYGTTRANTAQAGTVSSITLDASASATTDLYKGLLCYLVAGTGAGQCRTIISYNGSSKQAIPDWNWTTAPDSTTVFALTMADNPALNSSLQPAASNPTVAIRTGTAQAGSTSGTIKLDSGASSTDNIYNNDLVVITGGTGLGQSRLIIAYTGSTVTATVDRAWITTPDNTSTFAIYASTTPGVFSNQGVAQAGANTTITLASTASATSSLYNNSLVTILAGTGNGQTKQITAYNGSTKVATVDSAWSVNPDSTSVYAVIPAAPQASTQTYPSVADIQNGVWAVDMNTVPGAAARSPLNAMRFLRNKWSFSANVMTVTKEDDTTTAWTSTVTSNASAAPIVASDPA